MNDDEIRLLSEAVSDPVDVGLVEPQHSTAGGSVSPLPLHAIRHHQSREDHDPEQPDEVDELAFPVVLDHRSAGTAKRTLDDVLLLGDEEHHHLPPEDVEPQPREAKRPKGEGGAALEAQGGRSTATASASDAEPPLAEDEEASAAAGAKYKANTERWATMFGRLKDYKERYGDCLVPKRFVPDPKLGTFVETQRVQYKRLKRVRDQATAEEKVVPNNRLTAERLVLLESIGFVWSAKTVKKAKDSPNMPSASLPLPDVKVKRASPSTCDREPLHGPTKAAARATGFGTAAAAVPLEDPWDHLYQRLVAFWEEHGHCLVPRKYESDPRLARWVEIQRGLWNRDYNNSNHRTRGVGGGGAPTLALATTTPASCATDGTCREQQPPQLSSAALMPVPTVATLNAEPHDEWDVELFDDDIAHEGGEETVQQSLDNGKSETTTFAASDPSGQLDAAGRPENQGGDATAEVKLHADALPAKRLSQERKDKLDELGFVWNLRSKRIDDHWDEMFQQLCEYRMSHGDCLVPSRYEPNPRLGKWVETQRYEYTKLQRAAHGGHGNGGTADFREMNDETLPGKPRANPRLTEERLQRLNAIGFEWKVKNKMKRYYDKQWDQMLERLLHYKRENGHCLVPKRYPADPKLGTWCHTQRIQYKKAQEAAAKLAGEGPSDAESEEGTDKTEEDLSCRLTDERRKRLDAVGFCWSARVGSKTVVPGAKVARNSYDDQWDAMFNRLKEYKERFGHCLVPKRYKEDPKLGTWTDTQRSAYKKMKKKLAEEGKLYRGPSSEEKELPEAYAAQLDRPIVGRLTNERIRRLENLGFVWSLRDDWNQHYEELKQFKLEHGHCNVPARYETNKKLGIWVSAQRQQFKVMQTVSDESTESRRWGSLTKERIDLLNQLGFTWSIRSRDILGENWNQKLHELRYYRSVHGNCNVPSRYSNNPELGIWVGTQRTQYRLYMKAKEAGEDPQGITSMTEDRIQQLEGLGFVWTLRGEGKKDLHDEDSPETMRVSYQEHDLETMSHGYLNEEFPPLHPSVLAHTEL